MKVHLKQRLVQLSEAYGFKPPRNIAPDSKALPYQIDKPEISLHNINPIDVNSRRYDITYRWVTGLELKTAVAKIHRTMKSSDLRAPEDNELNNPTIVAAFDAGKATHAQLEDFADEFVLTSVPTHWARSSVFLSTLLFYLKQVSFRRSIQNFYEYAVAPALQRLQGVPVEISSGLISVRDFFKLAPEVHRAALKLAAAAPSNKVFSKVPNAVWHATMSPSWPEAAETWTPATPRSPGNVVTTSDGKTYLRTKNPRIDPATATPDNKDYDRYRVIDQHFVAQAQQLKDYSPEFQAALLDLNKLVQGSTRDHVLKALGVIKNLGSFHR